MIKTFQNIRGLLVFPLVAIGLMVMGTMPAKAQVYNGIMGFAEKESTVTFTEMMQYDATLQSQGHKAPNNQFKNTESEFLHSDMHIDGRNPVNPNIDNHLLSKAKNIQTVSPAPSANFTALTDDGSAIPPDVFGAAGANHLMVTLNSQVRIMSKTGTVTSTVSLSAFWTGLSLTAGACFDPKVVYDPYGGGHWISTALANGQTATSYLLIGVSATNDPTGTWHLWKIRIDATGTNWLDFPNIGFNKNWIAVSGNLFAVSGGNANGSQMYVFNKAVLYAGSSSQHTTFGPITNDFAICPAITYDSTTNNLYCLATLDGANAMLSIYQISGTPTTPVLTSMPSIFGTTVWARAANSTGADSGPQSGTTNKVCMDDDRFTSIVYRNHSLWCAHNAFLPSTAPTRCSIMWWQIDTTGTVQQNGLIDDATNVNSYVYPSVGVNNANDVLIGYSNLSSAIHPTAAYSYRAAIDAPNTLRTTYQYKTGLATYYKTFGGQNNRWGDYSATTVDPADDHTFWTLQEYASTPASTWGTWWAKVYQCNVPQAPVIVGPSSPCATGTTIYSAGSVPGATSYTWTLTGTGWSGSSTTDSISITPGTGSAVLKVVANGPCGSSVADSIVFTGTTTPIATAPSPIIVPSPICVGSTVEFKTLGITGISEYRWTVTGTGWTGTSIIDSIALHVGTGNLTLSVGGYNGCGVGPLRTVTVHPTPVYTSPFTVSTATPVQSQHVTVTYTGNAPTTATYTWFWASGTVNPGTGQGPHVIYWNTIGTKHINLTVSDSGCTSTQGTQALTVGASGIDELSINNIDVKVFPNPNTGNFNLFFDNIKHGNLTISLFDLVGQKVFNEDITAEQSGFSKNINVTTLAKGIYWLDISGTDAHYGERLIIK